MWWSYPKSVLCIGELNYRGTQLLRLMYQNNQFYAFIFMILMITTKFYKILLSTRQLILFEPYRLVASIYPDWFSLFMLIRSSHYCRGSIFELFQFWRHTIGIKTFKRQSTGVIDPDSNIMNLPCQHFRSPSVYSRTYLRDIKKQPRK